MSPSSYYSVAGTNGNVGLASSVGMLAGDLALSATWSNGPKLYADAPQRMRQGTSVGEAETRMAHACVPKGFPRTRISPGWKFLRH